MSDKSGFCCRCGKETERKEQVGLIVAWTCSTRCAYKASTTYARPALPELDKLNAARPFLRVMEEFIEWLNEEKGTPLIPDLPYEFFNINPEKIEEEKKMLEQTIMDYQKDAASRRPE